MIGNPEIRASRRQQPNMAIHSSIRSVHGISRRALGLSLAALTLVGASSAFVAPQAGLPQESAPKDTFALRADFVHIGDGTSLEGGYVTIENGKITGVAAQAADGVRVVDVGGHLSPGLIAVRDATGAGSEATESARKLTPTADVARAFDPTHPDWVKVLDEGITTVVLTPGSSRIAGGTAAIVSPATGAVVSRGALVSLGMSSRSLSFSVEPTSYAGLYSHLSDAFENAVEGSPLAAAKAGRVPVLMEAVSRLEVLNAIEFAQGQGLKGAIIGAPRASDTVDEIKGRWAFGRLRAHQSRRPALCGNERSRPRKGGRVVRLHRRCEQRWPGLHADDGGRVHARWRLSQDRAHGDDQERSGSPRRGRHARHDRGRQGGRPRRLER